MEHIFILDSSLLWGVRTYTTVVAHFVHEEKANLSFMQIEFLMHDGHSVKLFQYEETLNKKSNQTLCLSIRVLKNRDENSRVCIEKKVNTNNLDPHQ